MGLNPVSKPQRSVMQDWVLQLPFMQQSVLISSIRGADGAYKQHPSKPLMRWLRRCILISAFDKKTLEHPADPGGGSYTGPSVNLNDIALTGAENSDQWEKAMDGCVKQFMDSQDTLPLHFYLHVLHAASILGYKHGNTRIRAWWLKTYHRLVHDMHLAPETEAQLDSRLNDDEKAWRADETRFKK